jgi:alpha-beta hydrolase superfamily lysophospholipase
MDMDEIRPEVRRSAVEGGAALCHREWDPKDPKGTVVCVHGIRSHSAWYLDSCAHLARKGYRVIFPDRRGSGLNREEGKGGGVSVGRWVADIEQFIARAARELPGKPVHLLGISWGGRLAAVVAAAGRVPVRSVVFSTPGIVSLRDCGFLTKIGVAAALLTGSAREFAVPLDDPALFTDDPDERNYIEGDQFGVRRVRARFLFESRRLERLAKRSFRALNVPVLLMLAGRDEIVDNAGVKKLFEKCPSADRVLKVYPEARHTLEFDSCREEYFNDLAAWFDAHG